MGMASSQVRLLAITNRMHDIEYKAQCLQNAKIRLAMDEDEAYQKYQAILDATTLTVTQGDGTVIAGTFDNLMANAIGLHNGYNFAFVDEYENALIVPDNVYDIYKQNPALSPEEMALSAVGESFNVLDSFAQNNKYGNIAASGDTSHPDLYDGKGGGVIDKMISFLEKVDPNNVHMWANENLKSDPADNQFKQILDDYIKDDSQADDKKNKLIQAILAQLKIANGNGNVGGFTCLHFDNQEEQTTWDKYVDELTETVVKEHQTAIFGDDQDKKDEYNRYLTMFRMVKTHAGNDAEKLKKISDYNRESNTENANGDSNWLQDQIQSGRFTVRSFSYANHEGKLTGTSPVTNTKLNYTPETSIDKAKLAKAEAEYEHTLKQIDRKDKQYDTELSKLEAERNALDTEREGIKKVMEDNIDRTFGLFS